MGDAVEERIALKHEDHEWLDGDCPLCRQIMDEAAARYRGQPAYSRDEMREAREIRPELRRD